MPGLSPVKAFSESPVLAWPGPLCTTQLGKTSLQLHFPPVLGTVWETVTSSSCLLVTQTCLPLFQAGGATRDTELKSPSWPRENLKQGIQHPSLTTGMGAAMWPGPSHEKAEHIHLDNFSPGRGSWTRGRSDGHLVGVWEPGCMGWEALPLRRLSWPAGGWDGHARGWGPLPSSCQEWAGCPRWANDLGSASSDLLAGHGFRMLPTSSACFPCLCSCWMWAGKLPRDGFSGTRSMGKCWEILGYKNCPTLGASF